MDALNNLLNPLKPILGTVTHNLPSPVLQFAQSLLGETCTTSLLHSLDFSASNEQCVKLGISKALGVAIIGASSIVKIPQLIKLVSSQSATGLSFSSYFLETLAFLITLAYSFRSGFPFSTFGETALISVQNVVIAALILVYSGRGAGAAAFVAGVAALLYALLGPGEIVQADMMRNLQAGAGMLGIASKIPQIWTIWRQGTTGQLSAFAVFNYLFGSLSRIFTTMQEISDPIILYGYVAGFALNAILALQMIYYWNSSSTKVKGNRASTATSNTSTNAQTQRKEALKHISGNATATKTHDEGIDHIKSNVGIKTGNTGVSPGKTSTSSSNGGVSSGIAPVQSGPWPGTDASRISSSANKTSTTRRRG